MEEEEEEEEEMERQRDLNARGFIVGNTALAAPPLAKTVLWKLFV